VAGNNESNCAAFVLWHHYLLGSEVIRAGLRALQERDAVIERWLREEVVPAYDAIKADPRRGIEAQKVFEDLRAHHAAKLADNL
jgi:antitoxin ParD1/3/4